MLPFCQNEHTVSLRNASENKGLDVPGEGVTSSCELIKMSKNMVCSSRGGCLRF